MERIGLFIHKFSGNVSRSSHLFTNAFYFLLIAFLGFTIGRLCIMYPILGLAFPALLIVIISFSYQKIWIALLIIVCTITTGLFVDFPFPLYKHIKLMDFLLVVCLTMALLRRRFLFRFSVSALPYLVLIFFLAGLVSACIGFIKSFDSFHIMNNFRTPLYSLFFFAFWGQFKNFNDIKRIWQILFYSVIGIIPLLFISLSGYKGFGPSGRFIGGSYALFFLFGFIFIISMILHENHRKYLLLKFSVGFIFFIGIAFSFARYAWLTLIVTIVFWLYLSKARIRRVGYLLFILIGSFIFLFLFSSIFHIEDILGLGGNTINQFIVRANSIVNYRQSETSMWRLAAWDESIERFKQNPILGEGFGRRFHFYFPLYKTDFDYSDPHSSYLWLLMKMGLFGFIPFISMNLNAFYKGIQIYKLSKNLELKSLVATVLGCQLSLVVAATFGPVLVTSYLSIFFWLIFATIAGIQEHLGKFVVNKKRSYAQLNTQSPLPGTKPL